MSISTSLRRAAKLQEKIDEMRLQISDLLDRARSEVASGTSDEMPAVLRRPGRPKMFKSNGRRALAKAKTTGTKRKLKLAATESGTIPAQRGGKRKKRSPLLGIKRAASPSGPLAPAVVGVLKTKNKPMNVSDIFVELNAKGYQFTSSEPKKNLAARIYRLAGVKQVSSGLFAAI